jgi:hypothetical protein
MSTVRVLGVLVLAAGVVLIILGVLESRSVANGVG